MSRQSSSAQPTPPPSHWEKFHTSSLSPNETWLAASGERPDQQDAQVTIWDLGQEQEHTQLDTDNASGVASLHFRDDQHLVAGTYDGTLIQWSLGKKSPKVTHVDAAHTETVTAIVGTDAQKQLYTASANGVIQAWSWPALKKQAQRFEWPVGIAIRSLCLAPDGSWLAAAGDDGVIRVYQTEDGTLNREMAGHSGSIHTLLYHPQMARLISAGDDRSVFLWFLQGEVEFEDRAAKESHSKAIRCMALTPLHKDGDGEWIPPRLVTGSDDGTLRIWPLNTKRKPKQIKVSSHPVRSLHTSTTSKGGKLWVVSEDRCLSSGVLEASGEYSKDGWSQASAFTYWSEQSTHKDEKKRAQALTKLGEHREDPEVLAHLLGLLSNESKEALKLTLVDLIAGVTHRRCLPELREVLLYDNHTKVRRAAFEALRALQGPAHLDPFQRAFESKHADIRIHAIKLLVKLSKDIPRAPGLIQEQLFDDTAQSKVQLTAFDALESLYPSTAKKANVKPVLLVLDGGSSALQQEALQRIYERGWSSHVALHHRLARLLSTSDRELRHKGFDVLIAAEPALSQRLGEQDPMWARAQHKLDNPKDKEKKDKVTKATKASKKKSAVPEAQKAPLFLGQSSEYTDIVLRASVYLAYLEDLRAFGTLLQLSQSKEHSVRQEVAVAFAQLNDPRAISCLRSMIDDDNKETREFALDSLGQLVGDELTLIDYVFQSKHEDIRQQALQQLVASLQKKSSEQGQALLSQALADPIGDVRNEAFKLLWNLHPKDRQKSLLPALAVAHSAMRRKAIAELTNIGAEDWVFEAFATVIDDDDHDVRHEAYKAWQKLAAKDDTAAHAAALQSKHLDMRQVAIKKLLSFKGTQVQELALLALQNEDSQTRQLALGFLDKKFSKNADVLVRTLTIPFWDVRLKSGALLAAKGDTRALEVAHAYLDEEAEQLKDFRTTPPPGYKPEANDLRTQLQELYPNLTDVHYNYDTMPEHKQEWLRQHRLQMLDLVSTLGAAEGVPVLLPFTLDKSPYISEPSIATLCRIADESYLDLLRALQGSPDSFVHTNAAEALARLGQEPAPQIFQSLLKNNEANAFERGLVMLQALGQAPEAVLWRSITRDKAAIRKKGQVFLLLHSLLRALDGKAPTMLLRALSAPQESTRFLAALALERRVSREDFQEFVFARWLHGLDMEDKAVQKVLELLPQIVAGTQSKDSEVRFLSMQLLFLRRDPKAFQAHLDYVRKHHKLPKALSPSKKDQAPASPELEQIAFGTYVDFLRRQGETSTEKAQQILRRLIVLHQQESFSLDVLLPAFRHSLNHPDSAEFRKEALQQLHKLSQNDPMAAHCWALQSQSPDVGIATLDALAALHHSASTKAEKKHATQARELTIDALNAPIRDVRMHAAQTIQEFYEETSLEPFILALGSEHADLRMRMVDRLSQNDDPRVVEALVQALGSDDEALRFKAARVLAKRKEPRALSALNDALHSEDKGTQRRAMQAMVELGHKDTVALLTQRASEDPDQTADESEILRTLGELGFQSASPFLETYLSHDNSRFRDRALQSLIALTGKGEARNTEQYFQVLTHALQSPHNDIKQKAISDMEALEHEGVRAELLPLVHHRDGFLRRHVARVLFGRYPAHDAAQEHLVELLQHNDNEIRLNAALKLAEAKVSACYPILMATFQTSVDSSEQQSAAKALGLLEDPRALDTFLPLFDPEADPHPAQTQAAETIGRIVPKKRLAEVRQILQPLLQDDNIDMRRHALVGFCHAFPKEALTTLQQALELASDWSGWQLRQTAVEQLGELGDKDATPTLVKHLDDSDSDVRSSAYKALQQLHGEDALLPKLAFFDAPSSSGEAYRNAALFIAEHASPQEVLERLEVVDVRALYNESQDNPFQEDIGYRAVKPELPRRDARTHDREVQRILEQGLLQREPSPEKELRKALNTEGPLHQLNALALLTKLEAKKALPNIQKMLDALMEDWDERSDWAPVQRELWKRGLSTIAHFKPAAAEQAAVATLSHDEAPATLKAQAAQSLGQLSKAKADSLKALEQNLNHPVEAVRRQCAWALGQLSKDPTSLWKSTDTALPNDLRSWLREAPKPKALSSALLDSESVRRDLLDALIVHQHTALCQSWLSELKGEDEGRLLMIEALGQIGDEDALQTLDQLRQADKEPSKVRYAAYRAWRRASRRQQRLR